MTDEHKEGEEEEAGPEVGQMKKGDYMIHVRVFVKYEYNNKILLLGDD